MTPTPYEKLRASVYKILYPEGVPLEFGCEVVRKGKRKRDIVADRYLGKVNTIGGASIGKNYFDEHYFNLGKPLSLQDVLRAIGKEHSYEAWNDKDDDTIIIIDVNFGQINFNLILLMSEQAPEVYEKFNELLV